MNNMNNLSTTKTRKVINNKININLFLYYNFFLIIEIDIDDVNLARHVHSYASREQTVPIRSVANSCLYDFHKHREQIKKNNDKKKKNYSLVTFNTDNREFVPTELLANGRAYECDFEFRRDLLINTIKDQMQLSDKQQRKFDDYDYASSYWRQKIFPLYRKVN